MKFPNYPDSKQRFSQYFSIVVISPEVFYTIIHTVLHGFSKLLIMYNSHQFIFVDQTRSIMNVGLIYNGYLTKTMQLHI